MLNGTQFQNAYVTPDLPAAVERFRTATGVGDAMTFEGAFEVTTPRGAVSIESKIALMWAGHTQYEFIEPVRDPQQFYLPALESGALLTFHHHASRVPDWTEFRAKVERDSLPVAFESSSGPTKFLYHDARDTLGHYLEFIAMDDEQWSRMGGRRMR